jgi:V/A-type H+-transporting ATPase subunit K
MISVALTGTVGFLALIGTAVMLLFPESMAFAQTTVEAVVLEEAMLDPEVWYWGMASAALVTAISSIAAAYAVATVGSAAMGALAEKPELFGRLLIFVGLAEGIAIYGVIIAVLILNKLV